jgi:hypothetical protein
MQKEGRLKVVKTVTVPGKCYAISDGDRPGNPLINQYKTEADDGAFASFLSSAGNAGDMSATRWQRVKKLPNLG